jgi:RND family efflux transporter MFP subunit
MKKIQPVFILLSTLLILESCGGKKIEKINKQTNSAISVKIMKLEKGEVNKSIAASGQFFTDDETYLSFKFGGVVNNILVKEGDFVHKGQLLATLDLTEINATVNQAQLALEKAQRDYKRILNLYKDSVVTLEQLQNSKTASEVAYQQVESAKFILNYSEIRAVADGYILKKFVNVGQITTSGAPIFQTNGAGKSSWVLKAGVSDKEWSAISIGDKAEIKCDVLGENFINSKVMRKSKVADPNSGSFMVELSVDKNNAGRLASGMFGTAVISPSGKISLWSIPYEALLDGNADKGYVFVTDDNKTAKKIPVTIAFIDDDQIHIDEGLENHPSLIVSGNAYLNDQSSITISK